MFKHSRIILVLILLIASFLRLWKLDEIPVSMFGDELDVGYHAYSVAKTGKDYSGNFMPLHFQSLAEWRTPLYIYVSVPTVLAFGITPYGVRLPAAFFGVLGVLGIYFLAKELFGKKYLGLAGAFVLAFSPWHIQYSRAGFEVTMMIAFIIFGLYFFFYSLKNNGKHLWICVSLFVLTPLIYSTAKFFTPFLMIFLFLVWFRSIICLSRKKEIFVALLALIFLALPTLYSTFFGGGTQRFFYLSVFTDKNIEFEIGNDRMLDAYDRKDLVSNSKPSLLDRFYHNKLFVWMSLISNNLLKAVSTEFLFISGDLNPRHSIKGVGQFYQVELIALIVGVVVFFATPKVPRKFKYLVIFMIFFGALPAALTRDGGNHATRLIIILIPLTLLISFGIYYFFKVKDLRLRILSISLYGLIFIFNFVFYSHYYWVHNKYDSEKWWHYGFKEAFEAIKSYEKDYDKVFISMYEEPTWIFFASLYPYDPVKWHKGYPFNKVYLEGFREISYIDKYFFGSPQNLGLYDWGKVLPPRSLYLATEKEVKVDLISEPERTPPDLLLLNSIAYPSGKPAFYLFAKQ